MNVYQYIAYSDPYSGKAILNKFGYDSSTAQNEDELSALLEELVGSEGEPALKAIMDVHPDKEVILELNSKNTSTKTPCGCKDKKDKSIAKTVESYVQNAGHAANGFSMQQGNTFLIAAALILAVAIIARSNN